MPDQCRDGGPTKANGNCTVPASDDGLAVQCIGPWSTDKHSYLARYLTGAGGPRTRFLPPQGTGGSAFVDLFAGPGRARVSTTGTIVDGSPLIAFRQSVPFTDLILCDVEPENAEALERRTRGYPHRVHLIEGDCNELIEDIVGRIPKYGLNAALIDPYNLGPLVFDTIAQLASFPRMDLILHYPVGEVKRNFELNPETYGDALDRALATTKWRERMHRTKDVTTGFIETYREQLEAFGYTKEKTATAVIRNEKNTPMYHLVYASKHTRGDKIWASVVKNEPSGQKKLW